MRRQVLVLSLMAVVAVAVSFGLWRSSPERTGAAGPVPTLQPFSPDLTLSGFTAGASFGLGNSNISLTKGFNVRGTRISLPWIFASSEFGIPLDMDSPIDGTIIGSVVATLDAQCNSSPNFADDIMAKKTPAPPTPLVPYDWVKYSTKVQLPAGAYGQGDSWLTPLVPPYPWIMRQSAYADNFWLGGNTAVGVSVHLNTVFTSVPWSPNGAAQTVTTRNGGDSRAWNASTDGTCIDSPQNSTSYTNTNIQPPLQGDSGGPCDSATGLCADAGIYGMWTNDEVDVGLNSSTTVPVTKHVVNNGPDAGNFVDHWDTQVLNSSPATITAAWANPNPGEDAVSIDRPLNSLAAGVDTPLAENLSITCGASAGQGMVVLKNDLWPVVTATTSTTKDYYADDNNAVFVVKVVCGTAGTPTTVDKAVLWIKPTAVVTPTGGLSSAPNGAKLNLKMGEAATVTLREIKVNNAASAVTGNETLEAEVADVATSDVDTLSLAWDSTVLANGNSVASPACAGSMADEDCIAFSFSEPPGQSDVVSTLHIDCPATGTLPGHYSVVVNGTDAPAWPLVEAKPQDNSQRVAITVNCWPGSGTGQMAPDGKDDGAGLYTRWIISEANPDSRAQLGVPPAMATMVAPYAIPPVGPSFPSDTGPDSKLQQPIGGYVERTVELGCFWIDANGCTTAGAQPCDGSLVGSGHPADGYIDAAESRQDADMPAGIDPDGDCLPVSTLAQPGHAVDLPDVGGNCAPVPYDLSVVTTNSIAKDHDCDGLPDGIEKAWGSNPLLADSDSDGANDFVEMFQFTNPVNPDTDGDGFLDAPSGVYGDNTVANYGAVAKARDNCPSVYNPDQLNSDSHLRVGGSTIPGGKASNPNKDKMGDACDPDNDNDGLPNAVETFMSTDPLNRDSNGDHCLDGSQVLLSSNPYPQTCPTSLTVLQAGLFRACHWNTGTDRFAGAAAQNLDPDGDGFDCSTLPDGGVTKDPDNDNGPLSGLDGKTEVNDIVEIECYNTNPANDDTDGDGCYDYVQINDVNGSGIVDVGDVLLVAKRAAGTVLPNVASDKIFDVNCDGKYNIGDTLQVAKNQCSVHGNLGGCGSAVTSPCKLALKTN